MGWRMRASKKIGPIRITASNAGISYSAGAGPMRVTRRADGRVQSTVRVPGTGVSYVGSGGRRRSAAQGAPDRPSRAARRAARIAVPPPPGMRKRRVWLGISLGLTVLSFVLLPLLLISVPMLATTLVIMLINLRADMAWYRQYQAHLTGADSGAPPE